MRSLFNTVPIGLIGCNMRGATAGNGYQQSAISVQHDLWSGFSFLSLFIWSKCFDE